MTHCPVCFNPLESKMVTPCYDCGHADEELVHLANNQHTYREFRAFGEHPIILCDFCEVDFGSYHSSFFGLPERERVIGGRSLDRILQLVRVIEPTSFPIHDGYCAVCGHRLAFLKFLVAVRQKHTSNTD